jgi:hypothetical protein
VWIVLPFYDQLCLASSTTAVPAYGDGYMFPCLDAGDRIQPQTSEWMSSAVSTGAARILGDDRAPGLWPARQMIITISDHLVMAGETSDADVACGNSDLLELLAEDADTSAGLDGFVEVDVGGYMTVGLESIHGQLNALWYNVITL